MHCEVVQEKLSCYLDGVTNEATMEMIEDHLHSCSECRAELAALQALTASMGTAFEVEPPVSLKSAIHQAIGREQTSSPKCEMVLGMLSEFVDGELAQGDRSMIQEHVDCCEACAEELVMMQRTLAVVGSLCEVEPPVALRAEIVSAVAKARASASPLSGLLEKTRRALQPAAIRWAAGTMATAAVVLLAVASPFHHRDVVTVSEKPQARVDSQPIASVPQSVVSQPAGSAPETVSAEPIRTADARSPRHHSHRNVSHAEPAVAEKIALAPAGKADSVDSKTPSVDSKTPAVEIPPSSDVANADVLAEAKAADAARAAEAAVVVADGPAESKKDAAPAPETKPIQVKVAASEEPAVTPQDDKAYIRSLKQQMRMKKRGEGISVDLLDVKF